MISELIRSWKKERRRQPSTKIQNPQKARRKQNKNHNKHRRSYKNKNIIQIVKALSYFALVSTNKEKRVSYDSVLRLAHFSF